MRRLVAVAVLSVLVLAGCAAQPPADTQVRLDVETFAIIEPVIIDAATVSAILAGEQAGPEYNSDPPTSGARASDVARCGIYRTPIPDLFQVASLAQGAVIVQYRASFTADAVDAVERAAGGDGVIVAPNPALEAPVVLTAWGTKMTLPFAQPSLIAAFVSQHGGQGPSAGDCPAVVDDT